MKFIKTTDSLFFTKNDKEDIRIGDCATHADIHTQIDNGVALFGYPDDEGIKLNGGRIGAASAPDTIRKYLYKMTPHVLNSANPKIYDFGNIEVQNHTLDQRHELGAQKISSFNFKKTQWISFGGGHDYGYADGKGFLQNPTKLNQKPLIINFDAHLDVRPNSKVNHSGTPFFRLLNEFGSEFDFVEIGLQPQCNSKTHWQWALAKNSKLLTHQEVFEKGLLNIYNEHFSNMTNRSCFISIDMDVFSSDSAPGCSQSWASGICAKEFLSTFENLLNKFQVCGIGLYEVSPPLDQDDRTSKLAALIAHRFLSCTP